MDGDFYSVEADGILVVAVVPLFFTLIGDVFLRLCSGGEFQAAALPSNWDDNRQLMDERLATLLRCSTKAW
ncbi:hypothetical protein PIB30_081502, partial [Stylosanthes scabra]|nr:hypothetical protein [Stylosanthes scabra]